MSNEFSELFTFIPAFLMVTIAMSGCADKDGSTLNLIPKPVEVVLGDTSFQIDQSTQIRVEADQPRLMEVAGYFADQLEIASGLRLQVSPVAESRDQHNAIIFSSQKEEYGPEGYNLDVSATQVVIRGEPAGVFYAVQTLFQLLPPQIFAKDKSENQPVKWKIPAVHITDTPRFRWRGMHLDVGRHMFPVDFIKRYIDYIAMHKMNVFHWHLTEDQGWRIEIKKYPNLNQAAAWRNGTQVGHSTSKPLETDGIRYGGYYTQEEVKEVVRYAAERFVTVVPEIEMPGHSVAALTAYPELSCTGGPFEVRQIWGISDDIYCAGNEQVFTFLEDVLSEVMELFPSEYIHIGGDEAPKVRWEACSKCRQRITEEGLKDANELQSYFIRRMEKFINSHGRQIIGWDEILEGGLAPNAAVMSWRGTEGGIAAARQKHHVVMSPTTYCYLDYYQGDPEREPLAIGGMLTVEKVYEFEPVPEQLSDEESKYILGAQGNVWTEYIDTPALAEYMALPRMSALAEVVWSAKKDRNLADFLSRMGGHYDRLDAIGANYRWPALSGFMNKNVFVDSISVNILPQRKGSQVRYTLNGNDPDMTSALYIGPFQVHTSTRLKAREFLADGRSGQVQEGKFIRQEMIAGNPMENPNPGLIYGYYIIKEEIESAEVVEDQLIQTEGRVSTVTFPSLDYPEMFGLIFQGYLQVPTDGIYTFYLTSNDGSRLYIQDQLVVDNDGLHGESERHGQIALAAGYHPLIVKYFQIGGGKALELSFEGPGIDKQVVPAERYFTQ